MTIDIVYLIAGLILLVAGGHFLVEAGVGAAYKFRIAPFIVGATVVAFGTSAPELLVSAGAAINGHPEIALGNVVGSNIVNIALVLGITACIITLPVISKRLFIDWTISTVSAIALIIFSLNGTLSLWEGAIFFATIILYIISAIRSQKIDNKDEEKPKYNNWASIVFLLIVSCAALAYGAKFLVKGASNIAAALNISERVVSITIVAFGTSLPELVTSLIAAIKKQTDISIGNVIGSNIFNILAVLGIASVIKPIEFDFSSFSNDLYFMLFVTALLFLLIYPFKTNFTKYKETKDIKSLTKLDIGELNWRGGIALLGFYGVYLWMLF